MSHELASTLRGTRRRNVNLKSGRSARETFRATGVEQLAPHYIGLLADACEIVGRREEALTLLDEALQIVERTGEYWLAAELKQQKGQLLLRQGYPEAAEELYRQA